MDILTYIVRTKALRIFNINTEPTMVIDANGHGLSTLSFKGSLYINGNDYVVDALYAIPATVKDDEGSILDDLAAREVMPKFIKVTKVNHQADDDITDQHYVIRKLVKPFGNTEHHINTFADYSEAVEFKMRNGGELREMDLTAVPSGCDPDQSHTESTT